MHDNCYLCGADIVLRSQRRFQLYNVLFLLFENMTKSSQILSTGNPICLKWNIGKVLELKNWYLTWTER